MAQTAKDKSKWERGIKLATKFANDHGWTVSFKFSDSNESRAESLTKEIVINSRHPCRVKYYILLHELGHAIEMSSIFYVSPVELHGPKYNTLVYKVEKVKEEFGAWDRGQQIAQSNGWPIDEYFYVVRAKYISTYMIWANNRKHPHAKYSSRRKQLSQQPDSNTNRTTDITNNIGQPRNVQGVSQDQSIRSDGNSDFIVEQNIKE